MDLKGAREYRQGAVTKLYATLKELNYVPPDDPELFIYSPEYFVTAAENYVKLEVWLREQRLGESSARPHAHMDKAAPPIPISADDREEYCRSWPQTLPSPVGMPPSHEQAGGAAISTLGSRKAFCSSELGEQPPIPPIPESRIYDQHFRKAIRSLPRLQPALSPLAAKSPGPRIRACDNPALDVPKKTKNTPNHLRVLKASASPQRLTRSKARLQMLAQGPMTRSRMRELITDDRKGKS